MTKRLLEIDDEVLEAARAELGTSTIRDTVHQALLLAGGGRAERVRSALDVLAKMPRFDRDEAWR